MHFLSAIVRIVLIDLVLSGDNAVVIGMAAHRLEAKQRKLAITFGGGAAIVLRIALTAIAASLLQVRGLQGIGGVLLVWIGFKLLKEEEEGEGKVKVAHNMKDAIITILLADLIMSMDNVLGVAAASEGNYTLLMFGLILSMAILMFMGSLVADLVNKFWWLAYLGAGVIVWTGAEMIYKEPYVYQHLELTDPVRYAALAAITVATLLFAHWFHRIRE